LGNRLRHHACSGMTIPHSVRPDETLLAQRPRADPMPEMIRRFDPPVSEPVTVDGSLTEFHGIGLVAATAEGRALSHGSIVLRQLGLASVTDGRGSTAHIATGDRVCADGRRDVVHLVR